MAKLGRDIQFVLQDPFSSLNPRLSIATNIAEPLRAHGATRADRRERVAELLGDVGLRLSSSLPPCAGTLQRGAASAA
jgi:ABC-type microcin C transport system duplicated ATPase subunit YejF